MLLVAIYAGAFIDINQSHLNTIDVTKINYVVKTIEKQLANRNTEITSSGQNDGLFYTIIFNADENYNAMVFDAIGKRLTMVDLISSPNHSKVEKSLEKSSL